MIRAQDASERAREAYEEATDRPARPSVAAALETSPPNLLRRFLRSVRSETSFSRGRALLGSGKYHEAREQLREATDLSPDHDQAWALLAWSHYFLGESREAIVTFKTALRREPTWEGLYNGLGWSRFRLGRYHLAIAAFRQATQRNPDYVDAVNGLGSALFALGRYDAALPHLEKALRGTEPLIGDEPSETTPLRHKMAWGLYHLGRYREALAMFIRASLASPDSPHLQVGMGWCYVQLGQKGDARAAFQRALQLGPGDATVREGIRRAGG